jgi:hypothetical protein
MTSGDKGNVSMVPEPELPPHVTERLADDDLAELEVEVSDLDTPAHDGSRAPAVSARTSKPVAWYRQQVTVPRWLASACVIALLLLVVVDLIPDFGGEILAAIAPTPTASTLIFAPEPPLSLAATPFPTSAPVPTAALAAPSLGSAPTDCPSSTATSLPIVGIPNQRTYAVGGPDVWVGGFDSARAVMSISRDATDQYSQWGWPLGIALDLKGSFHAPVTLVAFDAATNSPLWWAFAVNEDYVVPAAYTVPAPAFTIDPQQDQGLTWRDDGTAKWWDGTLYLPGAGCYTLHASWQGGGWTATFAAGQ